MYANQFSIKFRCNCISKLLGNFVTIKNDIVVYYTGLHGFVME